MAAPGAGGFFAANPLSPPPSSHASSAAHELLPHPRRSPLKAGGSKESSLIRYVDQGLLHVQRRFAKRETGEERGSGAVGSARPKPADAVRPEVLALQDGDDIVGYTSFGEAARDLESLVDVIWISGTSSLQIPYLLNIALLVSSFLPDLPPSPRSMFSLLSKLDVAFASLLQGRNVETREKLPDHGRFAARGVSGTEKVRIKSIADRTRISVVEALGKRDVDGDDDENIMETATETEDDRDDFNMTVTSGEESDRGTVSGVREVQGDWDMHVARVYDRTVVELGDTLLGAPIGIVTEP